MLTVCLWDCKPVSIFLIDSPDCLTGIAIARNAAVLRSFHHTDSWSIVDTLILFGPCGFCTWERADRLTRPTRNIAAPVTPPNWWGLANPIIWGLGEDGLQGSSKWEEEVEIERCETSMPETPAADFRSLSLMCQTCTPFATNWMRARWGPNVIVSSDKATESAW